MTNEEKKAEFIEACKVAGMEYCSADHGIIPDKPVKMIDSVDVELEIIFFYNNSPFPFVFINLDGEYSGYNIARAPKVSVKVPWAAEDFDREQPTYILHKENKSRIRVNQYNDIGGAYLGSGGRIITYGKLALCYTLLDGTELYKEQDR